MTQDKGASSQSEDRAVVNGAGQAVSALRASIPSAAFSVADMLGYGHAAYCAGWRAALKLATGRPISDSHGYDWLSEHPPTPGGEPLWRGLPPLAQAIEARRAETGTGSVHESAVPRGCAQPPSEKP